MAITSVKTGSSFTNLQKYDSFLGPNFNSTYLDSATWLIQKINIDSSGAASVDFSGIPQTYNHLQLRLYVRGGTVARLQLNFDTASNYSRHYMLGTGTSVLVGSNINASYMDIGENTTTASTFCPNIIDILDYASPNKNKTVRNFAGLDVNGSGEISFYSALWRNTAAVTNITVLSAGGNFAQYSSIALYGVK